MKTLQLPLTHFILPNQINCNFIHTKQAALQCQYMIKKIRKHQNTILIIEKNTSIIYFTCRKCVLMLWLVSSMLTLCWTLVINDQGATRSSSTSSICCCSQDFWNLEMLLICAGSTVPDNYPTTNPNLSLSLYVCRRRRTKQQSAEIQMWCSSFRIRFCFDNDINFFLLLYRHFLSKEK